RRHGFAALPAWLWLAVVLALAWQQVGFWREARLDSDVMALLPGVADDALLAAASARMADAATRPVIVLLSAGDWPRTAAAAAAARTALETDGTLQVVGDDASVAAAAVDFYGSYRHGLLTPAQ